MKFHKLPTKGNFGSLYFKNDTLWLLTTIQTYTKTKGIISIYRDLVILTAYKGEFVNTLFVEEKRTRKKQLLDENGGLYVIRNNVYLRNISAKMNNRTTLFKLYRMQGSKCVFFQNVKFPTPKDLIENFNEDIGVYSSSSNNGLFYFYSSNQIYETRYLTYHEMPFKIAKINFERVKSSGVLPQTHLVCSTNTDFFWSVLRNEQEYVLVVKHRSIGSINSEIPIPIRYDADLLFASTADALYTFNKNSQVVSIYQIKSGN